MNVVTSVRLVRKHNAHFLEMIPQYLECTMYD